jgi:taurine dioxygenase
MGNEVETRATKAPAVIKRAGQSLKIQRLTPAIGAEVGNINIGDAARDPELMAEVRQLLLKHRVLFFPRPGHHAR